MFISKTMFLTPIILLATFNSNAEVLFSENFDRQPDWATIDTNNVGVLPVGWDYARTDENWHPASTPGSNPSMLIGGSPDQVFGGVGKSFVTYLESFQDPNTFTADGFIWKDLPATNKLYVQFIMKYQKGFAADSDGGLAKIFRAGHYDGTGLRSAFFKNGNNSPVYYFDWNQNPYGIRHTHKFQCDDQLTNRDCVDPLILDAPKSLPNSAMSANFTSHVAFLNPQIPDLINGGVIPSGPNDIVFHDQVFGDQWNKYAFYLELNSAPGVQDGVFKLWINDRPIVSMVQIPWIGINGDIDAKWNSVAFGGNEAFLFNIDAAAPISERERWAAIDNILVLDEIPGDPLPPTSLVINPE